ncbi:hypothetical protein Zmor_000347 [Zophobas morio]|uniref:Uncharacterized protein n=1 Tax=Zophobas morio TaxID=2755281 RepID=A0AA38J147_9CUCU|nr:hypothetical protein Zmor_000347 [Zophobas morio]
MTAANYRPEFHKSPNRQEPNFLSHRRQSPKISIVESAQKANCSSEFQLAAQRTPTSTCFSWSIYQQHSHLLVNTKCPMLLGSNPVAGRAFAFVARNCVVSVSRCTESTYLEIAFG